MNKKIFFISFIFGIFVFSNNYAVAGDEFVVDLSVLGDIKSDNKPYESTVPVVTDNNHPLLINNQNKVGVVSSILNLPPLEPKFPVVTKKIAPKMVKAKKVKPVSKPVVKEIVEPVVVPEVIEIEPTPVADVSEKTIVYELDKNELVIDSAEAVEKEEIVEESIEIIEPIVEPVIEPVVESVTEPIVESVIEPIVEPVIEPVVESVIEPVVESVTEPIIESEVLPEAENGAEVVSAEVDGIISFEKDTVDIKEEDKNKIDLIIDSFDDAHANKIGILSYNLESKGISFKNKRQSLARATNIRSYLISKGFKNFDIKVAEIDETSAMRDCVLISEIK